MAICCPQGKSTSMGSPQVVTKWSPFGRQMGTKWSPIDHQVITKWKSGETAWRGMSGLGMDIVKTLSVLILTTILLIDPVL